MDHTYGKHLWLRCEQPDAAGIVEALLSDLAVALGQHDAVVVVVSAGGIQVHPPKWK